MTTAWLWCPAYPLRDVQHCETTIAAAASLVEGSGIELHPSPLLSAHPGLGAWLPASERVTDLRHGLGHDWLLAARGGYGCVDLLPALAEHQRPLPGLVGFSDLTVLLAWWWRCGASAIHGGMPGVPHGPQMRASVQTLLRGGTLGGELPQARTLRPGRAEGRLFAGCLRVLAGLVGTPWFPDLAGAIVALEDLDERPYRLDRDLHQLYLAGCLRHVRGLIFGDFPADLPAGYAGPTAETICRSWVDRLGIPAVFGAQIGHGPDPLALPVGVLATLDADTGRLDHQPLATRRQG